MIRNAIAFSIPSGWPWDAAEQWDADFLLMAVPIEQAFLSLFAAAGGIAKAEPDLVSRADGAANDDDPLYDQAVEAVLKTNRASISMVQRHLGVGYNRAARLIERMEKAGVVSPMNSTGQREVLAA